MNNDVLNKPKFWPAFKALILPYWRSPEKWRALFLLAVVVLLNLGLIYVLVRLNYWYADFYNILQTFDYPGFQRLVLTFCALTLLFIVLSVYSQYLCYALQRRWRQWLTEYFIARWMQKQTYYRLSLIDSTVDNPDQRISEDVNAFVASTLKFSLELLNQLITFFAFVSILWTLSGPLLFSVGQYTINIPGYMVWVALLYAMVGTTFMVWIGRKLVGIDFRQERLEANLRFSLMRIRENSESIALYQGEKWERLSLSQRLQRVIDNFGLYMKQQKRLTWFVASYGQITYIFPMLVMAPQYFAKAMTLGVLMQISLSFRKIEEAFSFVINSFSALAAYKAVTNRLTLFDREMTQVSELLSPSNQVQSDSLQLQSVSLHKPNGECLLSNLSFNLYRGDRLWIEGPSGCGKSTLLRAITGIWPFKAGEITLPIHLRTLVLSQKPYLPLGTLRQAFYYPDIVPNEDPEIEPLLQLMQLTHLTAILDEEDAWSHRLSLGEQQRIALARAWLLKPDILLLDEVTTALDSVMGYNLYHLLIERLPQAIIISVGYGSTLRPLHNRLLKIEEKSGSVLSSTE